METFKEYQDFAKSTQLTSSTSLAYLTLGLCGESGEVAEKIKKSMRDKAFVSNEVAKELGDVLWYLTMLASALGHSLEDIAKLNQTKLSSRMRRNKVKGEGDNR